jgi:hypothetical protein
MIDMSGGKDVSGVRSLVWEALHDADLLLADDRFDRVRREAATAGRRYLAATLRGVAGGAGGDASALAGSVGLSVGAMMRMFGHGWQQAAGFATLAGARTSQRGAVARLGGLFNLGIVVFDHLCDTVPERGTVLLAHLGPGFLATQLAVPGERARRQTTGDDGVDFLLGVTAAFVAGARKLGGAEPDLQRLADLLSEMYLGERGSVELSRARSAPTADVWEMLRAKSALPMSTIALLAVLATPAASPETRELLATAASRAGEALWIVDDLADIRSDWEADSWSRPLWLLLSAAGAPPRSAEDAVARMLEAGIVAAEAERLVEALRGLRALPGASERALLRPLQAAVRSWLEEIRG